MMEIKERLALSARPGKLTLIREGMFLKCYQQSLFSLVHSVYPDIKATGRRIKKPGGQVVFSGGFPEAVLAKVLPDEQFVYECNRGLPGIPGLEHTDSMPPTREEEDTGECTV